VPQPDGGSRFYPSDTGYAEKLARQARGELVTIGETYYDDAGNFYHEGFLKSS
jgi:hypothetical protein